ncbi:hypothetical protein O0L34_g9280 [Tuta absoluta]|nr:hypothetical protein O0L34_g9280 [Tuta absoluta]
METHPIKYFLLNKNELSYEVTIRGETPAATVLELRKQITKLTLLIPNEDIAESGIEPDVDIVGLETSITDYNSKVQSQKTKFDANACKRIEALGLHIHFRLKRFDKSDQSINTKLKTLIDNFKAARAELDELAKSRQNAETPQANPDPSLESTECDHYKVGNLLKLKYDGTSSVHAFIQKVKDISTSRNIPSHRMLAYGTEIFTGNALHWFRGIKDSVKPGMNWKRC